MFSELIGGAKVYKYSGNIRWYYLQEVLQQIDSQWMKVKQIVNHPCKYATDTRRTLRQRLRKSGKRIRIQIKLLSVIGTNLMKLCYHQEGDGVLMPTTYQYWNNTLLYLENIVAGTESLNDVTNTIHKQYRTVVERDCHSNKIREMVKKAAEKMRHDTNVGGKLYKTLSVGEACRLFDHTWVRHHSIEAITEQVNKLNVFRQYKTDVQLIPIKKEIPLYVSTAVENEGKDILQFWKEKELLLPNLAKAFIIAATLAPSSATVERLFSLLATFKSKYAAKSLYRRTSVLIRYNENFRNPSGKKRKRETNADVVEEDEHASSDDEEEDDDEDDDQW